VPYEDAEANPIFLSDSTKGLVRTVLLRPPDQTSYILWLVSLFGKTASLKTKTNTRTF
jgi:hypothetical protein